MIEKVKISIEIQIWKRQNLYLIMSLSIRNVKFGDQFFNFFYISNFLCHFNVF